MAKKKKPAKEGDPNDSGLFRTVDELTEYPPGIRSTTWDLTSHDPARLAAFIIKTTPLLAAYRNADKARRRFPECPRRNAEFAKAHEALQGNPVARAIRAALVDAWLCWRDRNKSPRAAFVAGLKLMEAQILWAKGDELLRKKKLNPLLASRSPRPGRAIKNPLRAVTTGQAWTDYAEEAGPDGTASGFIKWLKSEGPAVYSIFYDEDRDSFSYQSVEVRADTVRKWFKLGR